MNFLEAMGHQKVIPNVVCFSAAMSACGRAEMWQQALALLFLMLEEMVMPDAVGFNSAISACEKGGQWLVALELLQMMPNTTLKATNVSYNSAISACEKNGCWEWAFEIAWNNAHGGGGSGTLSATIAQSVPVKKAGAGRSLVCC